MQMNIKLLNMPFGSLLAPSIALTQLKAVLNREFGDRVLVDICYASLDFAEHIGAPELYMYPHTDAGMLTGAGDWFFRQAAFPDAPENSDEYFARFYFDDDEETERIRGFLRDGRAKIDEFLDTVIEKYALLEADIVGFTLLFFQATASIALARRLKELKPDLITVFGGAACDGDMGAEFSKNVDCVDHVFSGPALVSFPEFVGTLLEGGQSTADRVITGPDLDINENIILNYDGFLDACTKIFPDRALEPVLLFETSRGCWWGEKQACAFCGLNGTQMQYRAMTPENGLAQIESLYRYADRCSFFVAVDNIVPANYLKEVFPGLDPPENMIIRYEIKSDLDDESIGTFCAAGVRVAQPGVEALATESLRLMRKGATAFSNVRFLKACSRHPFTIEWNLLVFAPGEPESVREKYLRDIPLLFHLPPPLGAFPVMFVRYSEYFERREEYGLELKPQDYYAFTYPFEEGAIWNLAYHFVDMNADNGWIDSRLGGLNESITTWKTRWLNSDSQEQARLCFLEGDDCVVYDSRSGESVERRLDDIDAKILKFLEKPATVKDVKDKLGIETGFDAAQRLESLTGLGLLFEEDGRFLNLVC